jgi:hypothetical protein
VSAVTTLIRATLRPCARWATAHGLVRVFSAFVLLGAASGARADLYHSWGNATGTTVNFSNIGEDTVTGTVTPLLGVMASSGNNLLFLQPGTQTSFSAFSSSDNAHDAMTTDSWLNFAVTANAGQAITDLLITEGGDFTLAGFGSATVTMSTPVRIEINNDPSLRKDANMTFTYDPTQTGTYQPHTPSFSLASDMGTGILWQGELDVDIAAWLASKNYAGAATYITVSADDVLTAASLVGASAKIQKKTFDVTVDTTPTGVPEPSTLALLGVGGLALAGYGWRRRRA